MEVLHGVSSTLGNYWIRAEWVPGRVWAFLEIWNAHSATYSLRDIVTQIVFKLQPSVLC